MIAPPVLLNIDTALWTRLCSQLLDCGFRRLILGHLYLVAAAPAVRAPWPVALEARLVLAVRALDELLSVLALGAIFDGEVETTLRREAGHVELAGRKRVLGDGFVITVLSLVCYLIGD